MKELNARQTECDKILFEIERIDLSLDSLCAKIRHSSYYELRGDFDFMDSASVILLLLNNSKDNLKKAYDKLKKLKSK